MYTSSNTTILYFIINYKEQYDCKWDPMILTNNTLYTPALNFYKYFGLMIACIGRS